MKDKSFNNLVFLLLFVVVFTWRKQENAFALQGKNNCLLTSLKYPLSSIKYLTLSANLEI